MSTITLSRTGDRALSFEGEPLASASTHGTQGPCQNRWWDLVLYRAAEKFVIGIDYHTQWQGEHERSVALVVDSADGLVSALDEYDWASCLYGYPRGQEARQEDLIRRLGDCWDAAVGELLSIVEPERL